MKTSRKVVDLKSNTTEPHHHLGHPSYYSVDPNFMDIAEAVEQGILPGNAESSAESRRTSTLPPGRRYHGQENPATSMSQEKERESRPICPASLTYVLESTDAGMGKALLGLWMAYGLAKKENRAFFIDDTHW